jgi:hypothetical protein
MIVVAGNPRSGTSLMMRCFCEAVGKDRIVGDEFPQDKRFEIITKQGEEESDAHYAIRKYTFDKYPDNSPEVVEKYKDMNPNGFWECPFTVQGIQYRPRLKEEYFDKMDTEDKDKPLVIKLVNSGLFMSDPKYIDKVVYMLRDPHSIAKSQERLKREQKFTLKDGRVVDLFEGQTVHDPRFFIQSTTQFAQWRLDHPDVPLLMQPYDDMVADPKKELKNIGDFTGIDLTKATQIINPKLKRSKPDMTKESDLWEEAEAIYECVKKEDWQGVIDISSDPKSNFSKGQLTYTCLRLRAGVSYHNCVACRRDMSKEFIESGIKRANANKWEWWLEPCAFECGMDPDDEDPMTIEESIQHNHWLSMVTFDEK